MRRISSIAIVCLLAAAGWWWLRSDGPPPSHATVARVVDGDTVYVTAGSHTYDVRLLGIDTPETVDPHRPVGCYGPEASAFTHRRLSGRPVQLTFDRQRRDRYGRLLAYVAVEGHRFNDELLTGGYARLLVIPPNGLHGRAMLDEELAARSAGRGLWGACPEVGGK